MSNRPSGVRVWLRAVRPFSFTASIVPIVVASALAFADGAIRPLLTVLMLVAAVSCHAGSNLANDYYDHRRGTDNAASLGPSGVIQLGLLSATAVRRGMFVAFAVATLLGVVIVAASGPVVLAVALLSLAAAYFYTGGLHPLGYVALGEVTVFLAMGLGMVLAAYFVLARSVTAPAALVAVAVGALVAAILHVNNMRDAAPDRTAGKRTLANLLGHRGSAIEFVLLVGVAYLALAALVGLDHRLWPALIGFVSVPKAIGLAKRVWIERDPSGLNRALRATAGLHLGFGLLVAAGFAIGGLVAR